MLGIASQEDLYEKSLQAEAALDAVERAQRRGAATAEDVRRAFVAAAEAQLATVRDSDAATRARVENEIKVKAAALGVVETLEKLGLAGKKAGDDVAAGAGKATSALDETAASADKAAASAEGLGQSSNNAAAGLQNIASAGQAAAEAAIGASEAFANSAMMNGKLDRVQFGLLDEQTKKFNAELEATLQSNAALSERGRVLSELKARYNLLNSAQLEQLATAKLEERQNQQRRQEDAMRQREQQQTTTSDGGSGAVTRSVLDINLKGSTADIKAATQDPAAVQALARALAPELERMAQRGGFRVRLL